jgi:AAA domain
MFSVLWPAYLIDGLIPKGVVIASLGKIKAGKTTFKLKAIEAILEGEWFPKLEAVRTSVLCPTEQGKESFLAQVQTAQLGEQTVRGVRFITHYDLIGMDWAAPARLIGEQAAACQVGLVVVDTFSRVALVKDENDAGEMQADADQ